MRLRHGIATLLLVLAMAPGTRADDVTDQINEALKAYQNHDTQTAIAALDAAANLLRQARADALKNCCRRRRQVGPPTMLKPARSAPRCWVAASPPAAPIITAASAWR